MNYKIKDQEIGIFSMGRTLSRRCKGKMIRKFGNTTITDIVLSNLSKLGKNTFFAGYESIFKKKSLKHKVRFVQRTKKSAECKTHIKSYYIRFYLDYIFHITLILC